MNLEALPLTYPDLVCVEDLDPFAAETMSDLENLVQDVFHILIEEPGSNPDDETRGVGIDNLLSGTAKDLIIAASSIDAQLERDDRIDSSTTTVTELNAGNDQAGAIYEITVELVVDGSVIPLSYSYGASGLQVTR